MTTEIANTADDAGATRLDLRCVHLLPKSGSSREEYEDGFGVSESKGRFAVADGATEAFDAGAWARRLAESWANESEPGQSWTNVDVEPPRTPEEFLRWAELCGEAWDYDWRARRALPWYAEEKRRDGSFAAFVGIEFVKTEKGLMWHAAAIGDSCLLRVRGGELIEAMPLDDHRLFNSTPRLVPSVAAGNRLTTSDVCIRHGHAEPEDFYWLLSDAMAAWCLRALTEDRARFAEFERVSLSNEREAFERFVETERNSDRLRDDDITFICIEAARASDHAPDRAADRRQTFMVG